MEDQITKIEKDIQNLKTIIYGISLFDPSKQFLPKFDPPQDLNVQRILDRINKSIHTFANIHTDTLKEIQSKVSIQDRMNENVQIKFKFIESKLVSITEDVLKNYYFIQQLNNHVLKVDLQQLKEELYYFKGQNQAIQATLATKEFAQDLSDRITRLDRMIVNKIDRNDSNEILRKSLLQMENQFSYQISQHQLNYESLMKKLENTESMIRRNYDKFEIYKENIQLLIEKIKDQKSSMNDVLDKKINFEQFNELKQQCEKYALKIDLADLQIKVDPIFDKIIKEFSSFKVQYEQYSKLISQLDYSLLLKANKMDIQIVENSIKSLQDNLQQKQESLDHINSEFKRQEFSLQNKLQEATEGLQEYVSKLILEEEVKAINERVSKVLETHNIKELIKNQYKIQFMLDKKADQSQIIQLNQNKANQKHMEKLEMEYFNLIKTFKITIQSVTQFMEVFTSKNEEMSFNHQKSEIQKSMSILYSLQEQLSGIKNNKEEKKQSIVQKKLYPDDRFNVKKRSKTQVSNYDTEEKQKINIVSYKMLKYPNQSSVGKMLDQSQNADYSVKLNPVLYQTQVIKGFGNRQKMSYQYI